MINFGSIVSDLCGLKQRDFLKNRFGKNVLPPTNAESKRHIKTAKLAGINTNIKYLYNN